jgi:acyl-[acyl-carrier-protein]-phospholipid O-acyltransferase/long-chain-fatty-acid--[acyl-carrier-protein] ligase
MFSSGSTGDPKGVVLSHAAIVANLEAVAQILWIESDDCIAGVLPFFHSFGFTATLCLPLATGMAAVYHANPLDAKAIGPLVRENKATILLGTPTFLQSWMRVATPEDFATLRHVVTGAERLRPELADAFAEKYGVRPLEGYGVTEMGPVIAVNLPDVEHDGQLQIGGKEGTVGHPVPGVAVKTVDSETHAEVPDGTEGLLLVKGPGMMTGYLADEKRTAEAIRDGWYATGDIAVIDEHGFIRITDRLARFSKIAGEMVPHGRIEEALIAVTGVTAVCVVGAPDESRGERLVALYTGEAEPRALVAALAASPLPKLWQPKAADIRKIGELPTLGSGKLDLRRIRALAAGAEAL